MKRVLIDVEAVVNAAMGEDVYSRVDSLWRALRDLSDELNSALDRYRVELVHYDTGDFLAFQEVDPSEGSYWTDQYEQRQEIGQILHDADAGADADAGQEDAR